MTHAWHGTLRDIRTAAATHQVAQLITPGFRSAFGKPSQSQAAAWENSLADFVSALDDPAFDGVQAICELQMPIGGERADLVLIGGATGAPKAIVVELKQWAGITANPLTMEVRVPGMGVHVHPSLQALNYVGKLHLFNSEAQRYEVSSLVFLQNATAADKTELSRFAPPGSVELAPLFARDDKLALAAHIRRALLPSTLPSGQAGRLADAPFSQSKHLFSFLSQNGEAIARDVEVALANTGMGLTEDQALIKYEIKSALELGAQYDFIVDGPPGSGKTLLAVSLLLMAAEGGKSCLLALRNNRLQAILKQAFDRSYPGASGLMLYFEPRQGVGIAQFEGHVDLLICDEAQRMESRIMPNVLSKATTCAIFLDETQRLNPPEQGTAAEFTRASQALGRTPMQRKLPSSIRCTGGQAYAEWVDGFLQRPSELEGLSQAAQSWLPHYSLCFHESFQHLSNTLAHLASVTQRVALVASFTESPGTVGNPSHPDNLRVGYPLTSGCEIYKDAGLSVPWLMSTSEYRAFWTGGGSNKLERIASIYGSQGFESDFVGVVWGRDLLYRDGTWQLGDPNHCYDRIDRLVTGRPPNHHWAPGALELVLNRYRIFLTRGIKGTHVFSEDVETRAYLNRLQLSQANTNAA